MMTLLLAALLATLRISSAFVVPSSPSTLPHNNVLSQNYRVSLMTSGFSPLQPTKSQRCVAGQSGKSAATTTSTYMSADTIMEQLTDPVLLEHIATGGALALAGDVIAQSLLSEKKGFPPEDWDKIRTAAFVVFGGLYTGGVQHFIFGFLNASFDDAIQRLLLAQFFFIPFCYYPTFLFMVPTLRAGWEAADGFGSDEANVRQEELFAEVFGKIPSTLVRNWCFWLPVQFVQFNFIPVNLQVTYCAAFGVIWNAILSWSTSTAAVRSTAEEKNA